MTMSSTADPHPLATANDRHRARIRHAVHPAAEAAPFGDAPPVWTVESVTDFPAFLELELFWNRLVDEINPDNPFVRHEWIRAWWECFGTGQELHILLVKADRELIAIVPLMSCERRLCGVPVRQLQ